MEVPIPLLWGDPDDAPLFTADDFVDYLDRTRGRERISIPPDVLITFDPAYHRQMETLLGPADDDWCGIRIYRRAEKPLAVQEVGFGAAMAVAEVEELIARGARRIIAVGAGGGIQPDLAIGDVLVVSRAIRDEGTSFHYLKPSWDIEADPGWTGLLADALVRHEIAVRIGTSWTTDAPYRETRRKLVRFRDEGVLSVDMEASALLAVARVRGVQLASVLVVSDLLCEAQWHPQFHHPAYLEKRRPVLQAVLDAF